ncbi:hypothetical protein [Streptomyces sp. G45]|uniref:hypothetical protein n=1 Tax=Streptomyces sp. G45 TaxID=3406627 RepID=UPI003C287473
MSTGWTSAPLPAGPVVLPGRALDVNSFELTWGLLARMWSRQTLDSPGQKRGLLLRHLRNTLEAQYVLNDLGAVERLIAGEFQVDRPLSEILLAQAERDTGLPSITSGIAYGLGQHTCSELACLLREAQRRFGDLPYTSKTLASLAFLEVEAPRTATERAQIMEALAEAKASVRRAWAASHSFLNPDVDRQYKFLGHVPPHDTSPCGVLRLAASIVPGAPGAHRSPNQESVAIAA